MLLALLSVCSLLVAAAFAAVTWRVLQDDRRRADARVVALASAIDGPDRRAPAEPLFDTERRSAVPGATLTKVAIGSTMAVVTIAVIAMTSGRPRAAQPSTTTAAAITADSGAPLELLSMRYQRAGEGFTVTGLVRNAATTPERGLIAVVFAFDRAGNFVSSARAPIEAVALGPGDESAFRVTVPNASEVGRYRVSFRTEAGVVRHVDRREAPQASAK